jgi:hypothetical protein
MQLTKIKLLVSLGGVSGDCEQKLNERVDSNQVSVTSDRTYGQNITLTETRQSNKIKNYGHVEFLHNGVTESQAQ